MMAQDPFPEGKEAELEACLKTFLIQKSLSLLMPPGWG